jgi:hypothetical protein
MDEEECEMPMSRLLRNGHCVSDTGRPYQIDEYGGHQTRRVFEA